MRQSRRALILVMLMTSIGSQECLARDVDEEEDEDIEVTFVKVPKRLMGQGYSIDFEGERIKLDKAKFASPEPNWLRTLYLLSPDHRIVDSRRTYLGENALREIEPDIFRVSLFGGTTDVHGDAFDKLFISGQLSNTSLELVYQPTAFGIMLSHMAISTENKSKFGNSELNASYESLQLRLGLTFDTAPFPNKRGLLGRTHAMFYLGGLSAGSSTRITDSVVTLEDKDSAVGAFGGMELRWPVMQFWIGTRLDYSYHRIEFKTLDLKSDSMQRHFSGGISYAF